MNTQVEYLLEMRVSTVHTSDQSWENTNCVSRTISKIILHAAQFSFAAILFSVTFTCTVLALFTCHFSEGYVTTWDVSELLESPTDTIPKDARYELVKQLISWRAHLMKITALAYVNESRILLTGSADGSVRYVQNGFGLNNSKSFFYINVLYDRFFFLLKILNLYSKWSFMTNTPSSHRWSCSVEIIFI